jgi:NADH-quinone oxidoreductase subunit M
MASLGMPGLGNFVAEFLVLASAFQVHLPMTLIAALGLITAAVYALFIIQRAFHGEPDPGRTLTDFDRRELTAMGVMVVGLLWMGLYPQPFLDSLSPVLDQLQHAASLVQEGPRWTAR